MMERLSDIQKRQLLEQVQQQCLTINLYDIVSLINKYENLEVEDFAPPVLTEELYQQLLDLFSESNENEEWSKLEGKPAVHQTYIPKIVSSDTEHCCDCGSDLIIERSPKQSQESYDCISHSCLLWLIIKLPFALTSALISRLSHGLNKGYRFLTNKLNSQEEKGDHVFSSVFAPSEVKRGTHMLIQVYLHTLEEADNIKEYACESSKEVERRDYIPLDCYLKKGDKVNVHLNIYGKKLLMSEKRSMVWSGTFTKCSFDYYIQNNTDLNELSCNATLSVNDVQVGEMRFITQIVDAPLELNPNIKTRKYNKIFISYAHQDKKKVKYIAEAYKAQGINYFFDRHYLKGGDVYPLQIQGYINSADLFILCWSENSRKSEYVKKEYTQALQLAFPQVTPMEKATLSIYPLSIEPHAELPEDMRDIYNFCNI